MRAFMLASALFAVLLCFSATAWCLEADELPYGASVFGAKASGVASQSWLYQVSNTSVDPRYTIWLLAVEVDEDCNVLGATSPDGWVADWQSQPHFVMWISTTAPEVAPGSSEGGFGVDYSTEPAYQMYSVMFNNVENPNDTPVDFGDVQTSSVPEPASLATILMGFSTLAGIALRKRR